MTRRRRANGEGSLYQRADRTWEAKITLPDGKKKSLYARTQRGLLEKLKEVRKRMADGLPPVSGRIRVAEYLGRWLEGSAKPSLRPYTFQSYSANIRLHIAPELGHIQISQLTAQDVQGLLNRKQEGGLSPRTVQYLHAILRRALGQAERWGIVPRNVARLVSPPRVPKANIRPLSPVEAKKLLAGVRGDRLEALYTVALAVGLRQGEALGLRWENVNLEAGTLSVKTTLQKTESGEYVLVEPKTDKSRRALKLPELCISALRAHLDRQAEEKARSVETWANPWDLVFTEADGRPLSRYAVTRRFQRLLEREGIDKHRFHDLRHTAATLLLAQGVPLRVLQELLGHSLLATTADVYTHVLPVLMADVAAKMDVALTEI